MVNTGGEKVFVEEVEEVLRTHPGVADALVVGRPSERWGQEVVALVALQPDSGSVDEADLAALCKSQLANFKAPKAILFVDQIQRLGNGKANYGWAKTGCGRAASGRGAGWRGRTRTLLTGKAVDNCRHDNA